MLKRTLSDRTNPNEANAKVVRDNYHYNYSSRRANQTQRQSNLTGLKPTLFDEWVNDLADLRHQVEKNTHLNDPTFNTKVNTVFSNLEEHLDSFPEWTEQMKRCERQKYLNVKIIDIIYNLVDLTSFTKKTIANETIHLFVNTLVQQPEKEASIITNMLLSLGKLAKTTNLIGHLKVSAIEQILNEFIQLESLTNLDINLCWAGLGSLITSKKLDGPVNGNVLSHLLKVIERLDNFMDKNVHLAIFNLRTLAENQQIDGIIKLSSIQSLLEKLDFKQQVDLKYQVTGENIRSTFYSLGLIAQKKKFSGVLCARVLQQFTEKALVHSDLSQKQINLTIYCFNELAKAEQLKGAVDAGFVNMLLKALVTLKDFDVNEIHRTLFDLGQWATKGKIIGPLDMTLIKTLIDGIPLNRDIIKTGDILSGIGLLAKFGKINVEQLPRLSNKLSDLLNASFTSSMKVVIAEHILKGLADLFPLVSYTAEQINILLNTMFLGKSYIRPFHVMIYLDFFTKFSQNTHHTAIDAPFKNLISLIDFPMSALSAKDQDQLLQSITILEKIPQCSWSTLLKSKFGIKPSENRSVQRKLPNPPIPSTANIGTKEAHKPVTRTPSDNPKPPTEKRTLTRLVNRVESQISTPDSWKRAYENNKLFKAIADKNIARLAQLLRISVIANLSLFNTSTSTAPVEENTPKKTSKSTTTSIENDIDVAVTNFLQKCDAQALQHLITKSKANNFELLLRACSNHIRYQLAIAQALHPILLYLPLSQLEQHVADLIHLEFYRDSKAILSINNALKLRSLHNPDQQEQIQPLQKKLLERAYLFHKNMAHHNVISNIQLALTILSIKPQKTKPSNTTQASVQQQPSLTVNQTSHGLFTASHNCLPPVVASSTSSTQQARITTPSIKGSTAGTSGQSLFTQQRVVAQRIVNTHYEYETEDIERILRLRLTSANPSIPGLAILAAADMTHEHLGNRVKNVLSQYLTGDEGRYAHDTGLQNIIIPIAYNHHWIGIRLQLKNEETPKVTYYNSITGYAPDQELIKNILSEITKVLQKNGYPLFPKLIPATRRMEQNDGTSCGAFLIESIYCDLMNKRWDPMESDKLVKKIRERHLTLLEAHAPDFYPGFYERQSRNQPINFITTHR